MNIINEKSIPLKNLEIDAKDFTKFRKYLNDFYGKRGVYPNKYKQDLGARDVLKAIDTVAGKNPKHQWDWDSLDRELVRDELIKMRKFDYPTQESAIKEISEVGKVYEEIEIDKDEMEKLHKDGEVEVDGEKVTFNEDETQDPQEIQVGNYQTKYFDMCPGASQLYKDIESKGVDLELAERSVKLQDALFAIEKHILQDWDWDKVEKGEEESSKEKYWVLAQNISDQIRKMAEMMDLVDEHSYIQGHLETIEKALYGDEKVEPTKDTIGEAKLKHYRISGNSIEFYVKDKGKNLVLRFNDKRDFDKLKLDLDNPKDLQKLLDKRPKKMSISMGESINEEKINLFVEDETFTATNKKTGNTSIFDSEEARDAAVKAGTHAKIKSKGDSKKSGKDGVNIFNKDKEQSKSKKSEPKKDEVSPQSLKSLNLGLKKINKKFKGAYLDGDTLRIELHSGHDRDSEIYQIYDLLKKLKLDKHRRSIYNEGFASDAQRKAAFASGYKEKGKKKMSISMGESVNEGKFKPSQVRSAISRVKKQLMRKWKQKGGYENFGQKELRQLQDKFDYNAYGDKDEREISHMLDAFDNWAMNYDGNMREDLNERSINAISKAREKNASRIKDTLELYKLAKGGNKYYNEKNIVKLLKRLGDEKKKLEKELDDKISSLYKDAEYKEESVNENFPNMKQWWKEDKKDVMRFIYFLQRQTPPSNKDKYEKAWIDLVKQLQKKNPAPNSTYKKIVGESVNEADVVGKTIFSDGKGKLFFGYYKTDDGVQFVDYKTWKKLNFKDVSKGDTNKERVIKAILKNQKQFNKKVEYNMWSKKGKPSFEDKMDWFIKNGWINNINKGGIRENELPGRVPSQIKVKLEKAIDQIKDSRLTYPQRLKVLASVMDALGVDRKELSKITTKIKSTLEGVEENELPGRVPSQIKVKLNKAIDQIKDSRLTYPQRLKVLATVMGALGIDRKELSKITTKIKSTLD